MASPAGPDRLREELARRSIALDRELGRGGMSVVYLARDLRHDRLLAVKVLLPGIPSGTERFLREIMLVSPLAHPHIVPIYDSGAVDGAPFFLMPYIEGESLRRRLSREPRLEIEEAIQIAGEVGEALEFAHARGILHRDIKPENILLQAGHALVADFGVARALSQGAESPAPQGRLTAQGLVVGTAEYVSPEQASGERDLDGRTDIYSLGCVLYEMLAGTPPFTGDSARAVLARRFRESPRSLLELRAETPAYLAAIVDRALAADPVDRFPTVTSFLVALRSSQANPSINRRPRARSLIGWPGALLVVAGLTAVAFYGTAHQRLDLRRLVVARLSNETGDSTLAYLGRFAADRLTASLAGDPGIDVVASATIIPSRLTTGLQVDSLDDPARLYRLAEETNAGTLVSGSYFRSENRISFQAEITNANDGTVLVAVGPVAAPVDNAEEAVDSLSRSVVAAVRQGFKKHG
ncbi:MAG: serine/threonine-protein kinase [Gemmatimonadales bacterium]